RALVCLVASCPCAIVISVPLAYFAGIGGASKKGIMIKGGKYVEALSKADCFVFDKTGTLTTGKIKVGSVTSFGDMREDEILSYCASGEEYSTHPIALAIKTKAKEMGIAVAKAENITEKAGHGVSAEIDGKKISVGGVGLLKDEDRDRVNDNSSVFLIVNGKLQGGITVTDTIREESKAVLDNLKSMGANQLVMLTGDREDKAKNIASLAGITTVYSNLLPDEKVSHMKELSKNHNSTVFVGDGINDAPVIALADCGIAMGLGSDAAIEASDAVLADGTLKQLPYMVKISRKIMSTIKANITFALVVKALVIALAVVGIAPMWLGVLSDTGLSMICILYSMRLLK
ncbi:MAG: heavy metal translocating P-type ATPase, partial [Ruminococcus sp.]